VQANLLAATATKPGAVGQVYNVALGIRTTLNQLFAVLRDRLLPTYPQLRDFAPAYRDYRSGDVRHSPANIEKAGRLLGFEPSHTVEQGLDEALEWYKQNLA
jgi:UDP-N-acetylglucosamine 4-epimerase